MVILCFGDIFGGPGRRAVAQALPLLKNKYAPDFIIGNAENLAGGKGVNRRTFEEMIALGFDGFTSGNHIWDNKEVYAILDNDSRLFRPVNFPDPPEMPCPGRGYGVLVSRTGRRLFVVNVMGRVFMDALDCPFAAVDRALQENTEGYPVLVDVHAETTSEKAAMGWHLAGRVSAVIGTHTHVQTADERVLPGGTAFITDIGLSGPFDSCIGMKSEEIIQRFMTKRRVPYEVATENPGVCAVVIKVSDDGRAQSIERIRQTVQSTGDGRD
jgi:2',3'-cyclic-nucleotide 2'-phosphodiesterase